MIVVPDVGLLKLIKWMLGIESPPSSFTFHFYTNNYTPIQSSVLADFTEASGGLIASFNVATGDWTTSVIGGHSDAQADEEDCAVLGSGDLYGYFVTPTSGSDVIWCERFDGAPWSYPSIGGSLLFEPAIRLQPIS